MYAGSWKLEKMEESDFCKVSCTRGHETLQKSDFTIFSNFHGPVYMKPLIFNFLSCKNEPFWKRSTCTDLLVGFFVGNFSQIKFRQYSNKLLLGMDNSRNEKAIHVSFFTYLCCVFVSIMINCVFVNKRRYKV